MHEMRKPARFSVGWRWIGIAGLLSFIGSVFCKESTVINWLVFLGGTTIIVNPILGTWMAATSTCLVINAEPYELLFLTTLSNAKLLEGYVFSVLHRLRLSLALMVGSIPSVVIRLTDTAYNDYHWCILVQSDCRPPTTTVVFHWFLVYGISMFAALGVFILGILVATTLALWWRNRYGAGVSALVLVMSLMGFFFLFQSVSPVDKDPVATLGPAIPYTILLYVTAFGLVLVARRIARPRPRNTVYVS